MSFTIEERTSCVLWYTESEIIVTTRGRFRRKIKEEGEKFLFMQDDQEFMHLIDQELSDSG